MSVNTLARWKEAATLILVAKNNFTRSRFDYRILMLKRSAKSTFMPNMYVFPGGVLDRMDFSNQWMDLYNPSFQNVGKDFSSLLNIEGPRPPIFCKSNSAIPSEVALRICAIRETFEESGILLLRDVSESITSECAIDVASKLSQRELQQWRNQVHNDATNFIVMCRKLGCVPDIWSLGEWSNWLTPPDLPQRFDTVFFISFIEDEPNVEFCETEMVKSQWITPAAALVDSWQGKGNIAPPQIWELLKFCQFEKWSDFKNFQEGRCHKGLEQTLIVRVKCTDAIVSILPQDDMHSTVLKHYLDRDNRTIPQYPFTAEEFRKQSSNLHRLESKRDTKFPVFICNTSLPHGQCFPVTNLQRILELGTETNSKL